MILDTMSFSLMIVVALLSCVVVLLAMLPHERHHLNDR